MLSKISRKSSNRKNINILTNTKAKKKISKKAIITKVMKGGLSDVSYFKLAEELYSLSSYNKKMNKSQGRDFDLALVYYEIASEIGYEPACAKLSWLLLFGKTFIKQDFLRCIRLLEGKKDPDCKGVLAICYLYIYNCYDNPEKCLQLAQESASKNSKYGKCALGWIYYYGLEKLIQKNSASGLEYFREAAEVGIELAMTCLGDAYISGSGVDKNINTAISWYKRAANNGHYDACLKIIPLIEKDNSLECEFFYQIALNNTYYNNESVLNKYIQYLESVLHKSPTEIYYQLFSFGQFKKAIEYGYRYYESNNEIKYNILWLAITGDSRLHLSISKEEIFKQTFSNKSANVKGILSYYFYKIRNYDHVYSLAYESAEEGNKYGQFVLGKLYELGELGVQQNFTSAFEYYSLAAKQNLDIAQYKIGFMYANGLLKDENTSIALIHYESAAMNGDKKASAAIASYYSQNIDTLNDKIEAIRWWRRYEMYETNEIFKINSKYLLQQIIFTEKMNTISEIEIDRVLSSTQLIINMVNDLVSPLENFEASRIKPKSGLMKFDDSSNGIYIGEFLNGEISGLGRYIHHNGHIYEGEWKNNKYHGKGRFTMNDGMVYEGEYLYNMKNGIIKKTDRINNMILKGKYINNQKQGPFIYESINPHNEGEKKQIIYYENDKLFEPIIPLKTFLIKKKLPFIDRKKYITLIMKLHGSDIINSKCVNTNIENHIRIISPVSCGRINLNSIMNTNMIFNTMFNISHLIFNKESSSYEKMEKFVEISNRHKIGSVYDFIEDSTTLRKP